jgi:hypothetical protein
MRFVLCVALAALGICAAGCVSVDVGQASKDWAEVGKKFADTYKSGGPTPVGGQAPKQAPAAPPSR